MNMKNWLKTASSQHKAMPILSFPGIQLTGANVRELVSSGEKQAECMKAIADRYDILASVSLMDLSVEAEAFGSPVRFSDNEVPTVTGSVVQNWNDFEKLEVPEIGKARTGEYLKTIQEAKKLISNIPVFTGTIGPFSLAGRLMDMTEIMMLCYEEPELVHAVLKKAAEFIMTYCNSLKKAGADGIIMAEPAAGLLSPGLNAEFSTPYIKNIIEAVQIDECVFIYHNCGNTKTLIDNILTNGACAYHFGNAVDLSEILPLIPQEKLVFGNIDPAGQFRNGTPESIKEATLNVLDKCVSYPNFIISSGCDIPPVTPLANIDMFFDTVNEYYRYKK